MIQFGTGGFRGIIGDDFTKKNIQLIGTALARLVKRRSDEHSLKPIIIGYDRRFLSKEGGFWLAEAIVTEGLTVRFINYSCPTPVVMFAMADSDYDYGCMITASHNPAIYNGVKIFTRGGRDADRKFTTQLERMTRSDQTHAPIVNFQDMVKAGKIAYVDPLNGYLDNILQRIDVQKIRHAHLQVVLDPMYGVATNAIQTILLTARCGLAIINQQHDTLFGGQLPAPSKQTTQQLQLTVKNGPFRIGIATDGDADRIGVVDADGTYVDSNKILALVYYYLLAYSGKKGDVVRNVGTSVMTDRIAQANGFNAHEVPVGFKYVTAAMSKYHALLGGESSGGLTVRGYLQGKDSVFAAALLVEIVATTGKTIGELWDEIESQFGKLYTKDIQFEISATSRADLQDRLAIPLFDDDSSIERISLLDGQKVWFAHGWCLARLSGTEPLLRISAESESLDDLMHYIQIVEEKLGVK
jgi:phosphomannomutase